MTGLARLAAGLTLGLGLGGCVAAAFPLAASTMVVKDRMDAAKAGKAAKAVRSGQGAPTGVVDGEGRRWTVMPGMTGLPSPSDVPPTSRSDAKVPAAVQYLYGSGEAAAASRQAYRALAAYLATIRYRKPESLRQMVLTDGATLAEPYFEPCGKKPPAVVLDVDETALLNVGYEADEVRRGLSYDDARWQRWERTGANQVVAVPGAKAALDAARSAGIAVIFNTNRSAASAKQTEEALNGAGLGPVEHGKTLWMKGDDGGGSAKDSRRWAIASGYCIVALVGDQLGDFSDLFNEPGLSPALRRGLAGQKGIADLWGDGWFVLPNPVYGSALKGGFDDVFPSDLRWTDPGPAPVPSIAK